MTRASRPVELRGLGTRLGLGRVYEGGCSVFLHGVWSMCSYKDDFLRLFRRVGGCVRVPLLVAPFSPPYQHCTSSCETRENAKMLGPDSPASWCRRERGGDPGACELRRHRGAQGSSWMPPGVGVELAPHLCSSACSLALCKYIFLSMVEGRLFTHHF